MNSFKDVVGHRNIIKYIESAVASDAVSHAYILNGERIGEEASGESVFHEPAVPEQGRGW